MEFTVSKKFLIFCSAFIVLVLIAGLRPVGLDNDSSNYVQVLHVSIFEANFIDKEPFFWLINEFNRSFFSGRTETFFLIFAFIGVFYKLFAVYKISKAPYLSLTLYVLIYFILHEMTQIRVGVAAGLFLLAIDDYFKKDMMKFFFKIAIACLFHYSAILGLLLLFFKRDSFNPIVYFSILFSSLLFAFLVGGSFLNAIVNYLPSFLSYKLVLYMDLLEEGRFSAINVFNIYYLSLFVMSVFFIFNYKKIKDGSDLLFLKVFIVGVSSFYLFSFLPVLAFRVSEFYLIVLIIIIANLYLIFKQKIILVSVIFSWGLIMFVSQGLMKNTNFGVLF